MDNKKEYSVVVENEDTVDEAFWWGTNFWGKMALAIARERGLLDEREDEEGAHEDGLQNAATN